MALKKRYPVAADATERVVATFVVSILGLATADGVDLADFLSLSNWKTWATAALISAFTLLKTLIAARINGPSASLAPSVKLEPVDAGTAYDR